MSKYAPPQPIQASCPVTPYIWRVFEEEDRETAALLHDHVQTCESCRQEVKRCNRISNTGPDAAEWLLERFKDFCVGFAALWWIDRQRRR